MKSNSGRILLTILVGLLNLSPIIAYSYLTKTTPPIILAHRAGAVIVPENTIQGWSQVREKYAPQVWELDIWLSADDSLMVFHDKIVDRVTDGTGTLKELSYEQLRQLDAAYWFDPAGDSTFPYRGKGFKIPTLGEVLDSFPTDFFNVEVKDSTTDIVFKLVDLLKKKGAEDKVLIASEHTEILECFRDLAPNIATSGSADEIRPLVIWGKLGLAFLPAAPMQVVQVPEYAGATHVVTSAFVKQCHSRGILVHVWTINDSKTMRKLLELGVDGIITDRPDIALKVYKFMGYR